MCQGEGGIGIQGLNRQSPDPKPELAPGGWRGVGTKGLWQFCMGLVEACEPAPTDAQVKEVQQLGITMLVTSRGGFHVQS